jgi:hypothetical protein
MKLQSATSISILAVAVAVALSGCMARRLAHAGHEDHDKPLQVPQTSASLKVSEGRVLMNELRATGVQIYECGTDKADDNKYAWNFKAPEADLFETRGKQRGEKIGKHYGGPTWEGNDGSKVVGMVQASENSTDANAITWLLLGVKSNSGDGIFAKTANIQRLETSGGKAPVDGCDQAHLGTQARVPYSAKYYFYN